MYMGDKNKNKNMGTSDLVDLRSHTPVLAATEWATCWILHGGLGFTAKFMLDIQKTWTGSFPELFVLALRKDKGVGTRM